MFKSIQREYQVEQIIPKQQLLRVHAEKSAVIDDLLKLLKPFKSRFLHEDGKMSPQAAHELAPKGVSGVCVIPVQIYPKNSGTSPGSQECRAPSYAPSDVQDQAPRA